MTRSRGALGSGVWGGVREGGCREGERGGEDAREAARRDAAQGLCAFHEGKVKDKV